MRGAAVALAGSFAALLLVQPRPALAAKWYEDYEEGRAALERSEWPLAEEKLRAALRQHSKAGRVRTYGVHFIEDYYPRLHLAKALFEQGKVGPARDLIENSRALELAEMPLASASRLRFEEYQREIGSPGGLPASPTADPPIASRPPRKQKAGPTSAAPAGPDPPTLSPPASVSLGDKAQVRWSASPGATEYQLSRSSSPDFAPDRTETALGTSATFMTNASGILHLRVRARDGRGFGAWSRPTTLEVKALTPLDPPSRPRAQTANNDWIFTWDVVAEATTYELALAERSTATPPDRGRGLPIATATLTGGEIGNSRYWTVRACDGRDCSRWVDWVRLDRGGPTPAVTISTPQPTTIRPPTPKPSTPQPPVPRPSVAASPTPAPRATTTASPTARTEPAAAAPPAPVLTASARDTGFSVTWTLLASAVKYHEVETTRVGHAPVVQQTFAPPPFTVDRAEPGRYRIRVRTIPADAPPSAWSLPVTLELGRSGPCPASAQAGLDSARDLNERDEPDRAIPLLRSLAQSAPDCAEVWLNLGIAHYWKYLESGEADTQARAEAASAYRRARSLDPAITVDSYYTPPFIEFFKRALEP